MHCGVLRFTYESNIRMKQIQSQYTVFQFMLRINHTFTECGNFSSQYCSYKTYNSQMTKISLKYNRICACFQHTQLEGNVMYETNTQETE